MKKWAYRILMIVCIVVFGFSAYQLWTIYSTQNTVQEETKELEKLLVTDQGFEPDWQALQAQNPDIIAWIVVPDCEISYPVVQGEDNSYYLDHTVNKEANRMGSIFLDADAPADFSQDNSIIYGHSVDIGGMFTALSNFDDPDFFASHPFFYLLTPSANYECSIVFFAKDIDGSVYYTTSFGDFREERLSEMKNKAQYQNDVDVSEGNFVTLSTCDLDYGFDSDQRLILMGKLNKTEEPINVD
ncbi:class B sortase [Faecalicoccus acidiformans]|uniref:class B sortase n=1 Tax=Faecalicoccus acidiformans TaxID=915173 RepID=UPI0025A3C9BB|nr:class B sortase [Faecalicoccus acidiformans]MDM8202850.1 class B sortase [Faecalicoccus acidiformans]